jgi:lipid-A-disaccharide synthase-like uncharacterized protein
MNLLSAPLLFLSLDEYAMASAQPTEFWTSSLVANLATLVVAVAGSSSVFCYQAAHAK